MHSKSGFVIQNDVTRTWRDFIQMGYVIHIYGACGYDVQNYYYVTAAEM